MEPSSINPVLPQEHPNHSRVFWGIAVAIAIFYFCIAKPRPIDDYGSQFFQYLAEGFKSGHLYMSLEPDPRMATLPDPYNPDYNNGIRTHDASYYKGHNYLYYGPTPVVTLYLPALYVGYKMSDSMAAFIFGIVGFLGWAFLFRLLLRIYFPNTHLGIVALCYASLGLCSYVTLIMAHARMYEVAVLSAQCFFAWSICLAWHASVIAEYRTLRLWGSSLMLGLAICSRLNMLILSPLLLYLLFNAIRNQPWKAAASRICAAIIPAALCISGLLIYNHERFGAYFNDGAWFTTSSTNNPELFTHPIRNIIPGFISYLFAEWHIRNTWIFFWHGLPADWYMIPKYYEITNMLGMFVGAPFCFLIVPGLERGNWDKRKIILIFSGCAFASLLFLVYYLPFACIRYQIYFAIYAVIAGLLAGLRWVEHHPKPRVAQAIFALLMLYGCAMLVISTLVHYYP